VPATPATSPATVRLWTQVMGKIKLAQMPPVNHWWHTVLFVSGTGLTTGSMPYGDRLFQFDLDFVGRFTGQLYEGFTGRGIIAWRGDVVRTMDGQKPRLVSRLGDPDALKGYMKIGDWNQVHLIARGNTLIHILNGQVMAILIDDDTKIRSFEGLLGVQLEGPADASRVVFRHIYLKTLAGLP
jgi:hypothetical protein